ncbi:MAG: acyl-CoA synthetase [Deltaproteobacteria bacterium]|nr:MAG: acyl-CoA synthetase [Deltaproteobacteria bacterium]
MSVDAATGPRDARFNLAAIQEAIAAQIPDRECIVFRDRRLTWRAFTDRTRRLANYLRGRELGCRVERAALRNWESGQDHLGLYLHNGNEYLEGMLGAYKARVAPFNVNYRYIEDELLYLLDNAEATALVYHARFAPTLANILPRLSRLTTLLQVADESGNALLPGAVDYEHALAGADSACPDVPWSPDDLYILYTGGTTGMPKGVLWRQEDIFFGALGGHIPGGDRVRSVEALAEQAKSGSLRTLPAPPFMHGAAHWAAFNTLHQGGTVVVQSQPDRLDAADVWDTIARERINLLCIVGDAFGRPLLDELDRRPRTLPEFRFILSGGAILTPALKESLLRHLPHIMLIDGFGASETGGHGQQLTTAGQKASSGSFRMNDATLVLKPDLSGPVAPGSAEQGWLARVGHVPLGYYRDPQRTAQTFPVLDGTRYAVPGDHATVAPDGAITVLGRGSVSINTGGEKVYPEEVEQALKTHPLVYDAVVVGTPSERWGQQVNAIVQLRDGAEVAPDALRAFAAQRIARYKLPKEIFFVDQVQRSPSGKADYRWAKAHALAALETAPA